MFQFRLRDLGIKGSWKGHINSIHLCNLFYSILICFTMKNTSCSAKVHPKFIQVPYGITRKNGKIFVHQSHRRDDQANCMCPLLHQKTFKVRSTNCSCAGTKNWWLIPPQFDWNTPSPSKDVIWQTFRRLLELRDVRVGLIIILFFTSRLIHLMVPVRVLWQNKWISIDLPCFYSKIYGEAAGE